jgi:anaerobic magnesium-protoporphyrin IX monomethyl ester cyclase
MQAATPGGRSLRVALIAGPGDPPRSVQGLGLPYLGAVVEQGGIEARIFDVYPPPTDAEDSASPDERLAAAIADWEPDIVGVTIHSPAYAERVNLAKCIRRKLPEALLVAGGHHPSAEPAHLLRNSDFDVCVLGEGEGTLLELAQHAASGTPDALQHIRGVVYRHAGRIARTSGRPRVRDVDSLPFPAHHLLGLEHYAPHPLLGVRSTGIVTYRGCPIRCVHCVNPQGLRVRKRSPAKVVDEMARAVAGFDVRGFNVYDNLFGIDREHALAVCEEIARRRLDVIWDCWTAGDLVDVELAHKMRAAGCTRVGFGAESGDDEILGRARRGFSAAQHRAGIEALKSAGLQVEAFFMVGLPGESKESVQRTVEFAKRCGSDEVCLSLNRPYPGTALWRTPRAFGVRVVRGPNFEAYIETESLSRAALLDCVRQASEELRRCGLQADVLRYDQYPWE